MRTTAVSVFGFAAFTLALMPSTIWAYGGQIVHLDGVATVSGKGTADMPASVGSRVASGDILTTAKLSKAQLRFDDDSLFTVVAESGFKVEEFKLSRQDRAGSAIFSLLRGGFRTITGLIGKAKSDKYEIRTGVATIGVRGTAYAAVICGGQCPKGFANGLWVKAEKGIIIMANPAGTLELRAGQGGYAAAKTSAPIRVRMTPFDDPGFAADFDFTINFDLEVDPPRIEPEPPASPS